MKLFKVIALAATAIFVTACTDNETTGQGTLDTAPSYGTAEPIDNPAVGAESGTTSETMDPRATPVDQGAASGTTGTDVESGTTDMDSGTTDVESGTTDVEGETETDTGSY